MNALIKASSLAVCGLRTTGAKALSTVTQTTAVQSTKHKVPQRRASRLLNEIKVEEFENLKAGRDFSHIRAGDSVEIHKLPYISATKPNIIKGVVLGIANRHSDTGIKLINLEFGVPVHRHLNLYSPMIKDIKVLQKAFIHKGKKRVRRSKLYYLLDKNPNTYSVV